MALSVGQEMFSMLKAISNGELETGLQCEDDVTSSPLLRETNYSLCMAWQDPVRHFDITYRIMSYRLN